MLKEFILSIRENPKKGRKIIYIILGFLFVAFILFSDTGIFKRFSLESQKAELIEKIDNAKNESDSLRKRVKMLKNDNEEIERVAREKYGMKKKGETIYLIENNSEETTE